jgi:Holliday junction resolvasome RuvABC endonuclease subunit
MPIIIPPQFQTYKILGIDPGLNHTGVSIFTLDQFSSILEIEAHTLHIERLPNCTEYDPIEHSERFIKLSKLYWLMHEAILTHQPVSIAIEAPFYNRKFPAAYGALLEVVSYVYQSVVDVNPNIYFKAIEPIVVKQAVHAGIKTGKLDVADSIRKIPEIMRALRGDFDTLDEHAVDSIAVAYAFLKHIGN